VPPPAADQKPQTIGETVGTLGKSVEDIRTNLSTNLGIQVHGLVDAGYDYNLNHPNTSMGSKGGPKARDRDSLAKRDGFELPRPFRIRWKEVCRVWGTMRLPKKAAVVKRIYQPGFGSSLQISVVSLVRYARARSWVMSNVRRTFRVSNSQRLSGEIANEDPSPYLARSPTFLLFLRQRAIAFV